MAIFIPDRFITEQKMSMKDYHFVVLYSSPPPFTIGGKRCECKKDSLICMEPELEITVHSQKDTPPAKYMSFFCGFVSSGRFSTEFKRREGAAPLEYRKSMKDMS